MPLILSVLEIKMVSGGHGLKVPHKLLVILVKLSHQNNVPHIHSRAMWFNWCRLPRDAQPAFNMDPSLSRVVLILTTSATVISLA